MSNQLRYAYVETRRRVHRVIVDGSGGFSSREQCNLDAGNEARFVAVTAGPKRPCRHCFRGVSSEAHAEVATGVGAVPG